MEQHLEGRNLEEAAIKVNGIGVPKEVVERMGAAALVEQRQADAHQDAVERHEQVGQRALGHIHQ